TRSKRDWSSDVCSSDLIVMKLTEELLEHQDKEEEILFPYVKKLVKAEQEGKSVENDSDFTTAADPVAMMEAEHEEAGEMMETIQIGRASCRERGNVERV